jgi:hypothetical protein
VAMVDDAHVALVKTVEKLIHSAPPPLVASWAQGQAYLSSMDGEVIGEERPDGEVLTRRILSGGANGEARTSDGQSRHTLPPSNSSVVFEAKIAGSTIGRVNDVAATNVAAILRAGLATHSPPRSAPV